MEEEPKDAASYQYVRSDVEARVVGDLYSKTLHIHAAPNAGLTRYRIPAPREGRNDTCDIPDDAWSACAALLVPIDLVAEHRKNEWSFQSAMVTTSGYSLADSEEVPTAREFSGFPYVSKDLELSDGREREITILFGPDGVWISEESAAMFRHEDVESSMR